MGMKEENLRLRDHDPEELCFYSKATTDFEFLFPFGWGELWGVADRTDYDLSQHQNDLRQVDLTYFDQETERALYPLCRRAVPGRGAQRAGRAVRRVRRGGRGRTAKNDVRVVLRLHPALAPYKAAILPLSQEAERSLSS